MLDMLRRLQPNVPVVPVMADQILEEVENVRAYAVVLAMFADRAFADGNPSASDA
jgi:hypothetical protein